MLAAEGVQREVTVVLVVAVKEPLQQGLVDSQCGACELAHGKFSLFAHNLNDGLSRARSVELAEPHALPGAQGESAGFYEQGL